MASIHSARSGRGAGDILELLRRDHLRVDHLLDQIEDTREDEEQRRGQLFAQFAAEIEVHSDAEDQIVYSALESRAGFEEFIETARDRHDQIEQMVEELDQIEATSGDWLAKVSQLRQLVREHLDDEEGRLFPKMSEELSAEERGVLAQEFIAVKESEEEDEPSRDLLPDLPAGVGAGAGREPDEEPDGEREVESPGKEELESLSKKELYELARSRHIEGRSAMTKAELLVAIRSATK